MSISGLLWTRVVCYGCEWSTVEDCGSCGRYQSNMTKEILDTVVSIQPKDSSGGGGETRESRVFRIAADMLQKLPEDYNMHEVRITTCMK